MERRKSPENHLGNEAPEEATADALKMREATFFNVADRIKSLGDVGPRFGVLLSREELLKAEGHRDLPKVIYGTPSLTALAIYNSANLFYATDQFNVWQWFQGTAV